MISARITPVGAQKALVEKEGRRGDLLRNALFPGDPFRCLNACPNSFSGSPKEGSVGKRSLGEEDRSSRNDDGGEKPSQRTIFLSKNETRGEGTPYNPVAGIRFRGAMDATNEIHPIHAGVGLKRDK